MSYTLVGAGIGAIGSVLMAGGQFAGIDSLLRQGITLLTGIVLIWMGLMQVLPKGLPNLPFLHPLKQAGLHQRLNTAMMRLSAHSHSLTPILLGMTWGLIPCGFLYAAQIKAAATGNLWTGAATMLAFGLGTVPSMLGIGLSTSRMSRDRRGQLFRMGGWVMLTIGILTLLRTSDDGGLHRTWRIISAHADLSGSSTESGMALATHLSPWVGRGGIYSILCPCGIHARSHL